jgi:hypothetical protein
MSASPGICGTGERESGSFPLLGIYQIDGVALITCLGPGMGLVTLITSFHLRPVGPGGRGIVSDIAMAIETYGFFLGMKLMGDFYNPDVGQVGLFPFGKVRVAAQTAVVHKVIAGRKLTGDDFSRSCVAILAGNRCRVGAGRKPPRHRLLILMTSQAKKLIGRSKMDQPQSRDGSYNQDDRNDEYPDFSGQLR